MTPPLTPLAVQRLAYIRYLYNEGIEQSQQPSVLSARALTSFHDAVENFLGLIVEQLEVDVRKAPDFIQYWEVIKEKFELPSKAVMKRLNDWRVALKHNGSFPSSHQIEQARQAVADFFTTVTPKVFGVDFESIDMVDLVSQSEVALLLREAQTHADIGDYMHAAAGLHLGMEALLDHYAREGTHGRVPSPFAFGERIAAYDKPKHGLGQSTEASLAKTMEIVQEMQTALRVVSLGIDLPKYLRFHARVPHVHGYMDGSQSYTVAESYKTITAEEYEWSRQFVIESALRAARADGIHAMMDADAEMNWQASLNRRRKVESRNWTGAANDPAQEETPIGDPEPPTMDA
ncbi:hypothetical protein PV413_03300 [Streptomyces scabiei]|uniref:hypothetical protein n=1 Tax=Streptomyces scabiei TaxID=1930 RepID=UPI000E68439E|nr:MULTISPECIES: hypothetical protein [Streptomyces]MDX2749632.1 hypothetical protein [Streptomyces scabiei]MDX3146500.1 hypothetical protein [Streptomyces scabiei]MDX3196906.1 hypothetical protein [Streptomyces scabiei]QTU45947.1 hypothetical protein F3K20_14680 [Streptomyces sp. LBUM 1482]